MVLDNMWEGVPVIVLDNMWEGGQVIVLDNTPLA